MRVSLTQSLVIVAAALLCGCAARTNTTGGPPRPPSTGAVSPDTGASGTDLSDYMAKVRHLSANQQSVPKSSVQETLESRMQISRRICSGCPRRQPLPHIVRLLRDIERAACWTPPTDTTTPR